MRPEKKCFQGEDLTTVSKRALCQQPKLDRLSSTIRAGAKPHPIEDHLCGFAELHICRIQHREFLAWIDEWFRVGLNSKIVTPLSDHP